MDDLKTSVLYFGDNLEILRKYIPDDSIDLVYLDPPFNSKKDYNILFRENGGVESEAQIKAFTDSWHWTQMAENTYHEIVTRGPLKVGKLIGALHDALGNNDVMAYLVMMAIRLVELHRVLKPTGSLYLHCDPTASDAIGVLITLEPPTTPMKVEAVDAGFYHSPIYDKDYPKIQILTVEELLQGKAVDMPPQTQTDVTFVRAPRLAAKEGEQLAME